MYGLSTKKVAVVERWPLVEWRSDCIKNCRSIISGLKFGPIWFGTNMHLRITIQSNAVSTDIEGVIESARIKQIKFTENVRAFFPQRQSKLSLIMRCPHQVGVCKGGFDCILLRNHLGQFLVSTNQSVCGFLVIRSSKLQQSFLLWNKLLLFFLHVSYMVSLECKSSWIFCLRWLNHSIVNCLQVQTIKRQMPEMNFTSPSPLLSSRWHLPQRVWYL